MRRLQSTYVSATGDAIDGRTRVFALIFAGTEKGATGIPPVIEFKDGGSSGDILLQVNDNPNSHSSAVYGCINTLDLPSEGVLFPSGVYVNAYTDMKGVCIVFEGGAPS